MFWRVVEVILEMVLVTRMSFIGTQLNEDGLLEIVQYEQPAERMVEVNEEDYLQSEEENVIVEKDDIPPLQYQTVLQTF